MLPVQAERPQRECGSECEHGENPREVWPLAENENALVAVHDMVHRVQIHQPTELLRDDRERVDDGREPEPELQNDVEALVDVSEKDVEHAKAYAQPKGEHGLHEEHEEIVEDAAKREPSYDDEEHEEEREADNVVQERGARRDDGQADAREGNLFEQVAVR